MSEIELFENQRAKGYDQFVETWIPNYHYFMEQLPKLLRNTVHKHLLVVGCGTGTEIEYFIKSKESWTITGIDPSPEMILQAQTRLQGYKNTTLLKGVVGDLNTIDLFGAATLILVLHFMKDDGTKLSLLKDIAQRLEKDAPFVLLDITGDKLQIKQNLNILKQLLSSDVDQESIDYRLHRIENKLHPISEERLSELLVEAGFEIPLRFFQNSIYMGWITKRK